LVEKHALPKARYQMMEENRDDDPGKLIAWAQTRSTTKGSEQTGSHRVLKFILTLRNDNHELFCMYILERSFRIDAIQDRNILLSQASIIT
jgi:hypothetical protein